MHLKISIFLLSVIILLNFCSCNAVVADKELSSDDSSRIISKTDKVYNQISPEIESKASSNPDIYENPYMFDQTENDISDYELYWTLRKNGIVFLSKVCREMSEKHWENITSKEGFIEDFCNYGVYPTPEEKEKFLFTVTGSADCLGEPLNVMVIIALSDDNLAGEISRVLYPGTREWHHVSYGYDETEIVDAYNVDFWNCMTAY